MTKRILIIQGHPDRQEKHFGHALADSYAQGAGAGGHEVRNIAVAQLDFPMLRSKAEWESGNCVPAIQQAQEAIRRAEHLVIIYPLWLGSMPALLKAFFEQVFRPGLAIGNAEPGKRWKKLLAGRSARIIVTMGMPALVYRWFFFAHSLKSLERNILAFVGMHPVRASIIGMVEGPDSHRTRSLARLRRLGEQGR